MTSLKARKGLWKTFRYLSVSYRCPTNHSKTLWLKTNTICLWSAGLWGQFCWSGGIGHGWTASVSMVRTWVGWSLAGLESPHVCMTVGYPWQAMGWTGRVISYPPTGWLSLVHTLVAKLLESLHEVYSELL